MPKLKSLRAQIGAYGRVAAGGIIDVDESAAGKLLKTKLFVRASEEDIDAAQKAQKRALSTAVPGTAAGFMPVPEKPNNADRLARMIENGEISREKAKELATLEMSLSTEEVRAQIQREADEITAQLDTARADIDAREQELDKREQDLAEREKALEASMAKIGEDKVAVSAKAAEEKLVAAAKDAEDKAVAANAEARSNSAEHTSSETAPAKGDQAATKSKRSAK